MNALLQHSNAKRAILMSFNDASDASDLKAHEHASDDASKVDAMSNADPSMVHASRDVADAHRISWKIDSVACSESEHTEKPKNYESLQIPMTGFQLES